AAGTGGGDQPRIAARSRGKRSASGRPVGWCPAHGGLQMEPRDRGACRIARLRVLPNARPRNLHLSPAASPALLRLRARRGPASLLLSRRASAPHSCNRSVRLSLDATWDGVWASAHESRITNHESPITNHVLRRHAAGVPVAASEHP